MNSVFGLSVVGVEAQKATSLVSLGGKLTKYVLLQKQ